MEKDKKPENPTAIFKYINSYSRIYPEKITKYWKRRLYGGLPSIVFYNKKEIKEIDFSQYICDKDILEMFYRLESKMIRDGHSVYTIDYFTDDEGKVKFFINVSNLVIFSEIKTKEIFVQTIGNVAKGTIPVIELRTYGKYQDIREYQEDPNHEYTDNEQKELKKILKEKEVINHNLGVIRAGVMTNNINFENWEGRPEITEPIWEKIRTLDIMFSRLMTKIELETTHLSIVKESGAIVADGEKRKEQLKVENERLRENYSGDFKVSEYSVENVDDVDATIVQGSPDLASLRDQISLEVLEIDKILGISDDYNSEGKTNDVEAKVDKVGDSSSMESVRRKMYRQSQFQEVFTKIFKIAKSIGVKEFQDVDRVEVSFYVSDYRKKMAMIKAFPNILGQIPVEEAIKEIFQVDNKTAKEWVEGKEKEIHKNLTSFLASNNNNLPSGMENLKGMEFVDYERIDEKNKEKQEQQQQQPNNGGGKND